MSGVTGHLSGVTCQVSGVLCHVSVVTFHVSYVTCHMSHDIFFFFFFLHKVVEIVNGGSVINGAYPDWFLTVYKKCLCVYGFEGGGRVGGGGVLRYFLYVRK